MKKIIDVSVAALGFAAIMGCSTTSQPVFYPNEAFQKASIMERQADIRQCRTLADQYMGDRDNYMQIAKETAAGAVTGAASGAVAGPILDESTGETTAAGAAVGSIVALSSGLLKQGETDPGERRFMEHCLEQRGYRVVDWNTQYS